MPSGRNLLRSDGPLRLLATENVRAKLLNNVGAEGQKEQTPCD